MGSLGDGDGSKLDIEVAQQLNAMDLPFGSAFIVAALAIYIFKQYLELKKQHLEIRAKLMEMSTTTSGAAIAGPLRNQHLWQKFHATNAQAPTSQVLELVY